MRFQTIALCAALLATAGTAVVAADMPTVVTPGQEQWKHQDQGNYDMAVLYGDPSKAGFYVVRLKVPANWSIPAHTHPAIENVTIISGTFYAGIGSKLDASKVMEYPAGSFISLPANLPHYALTKDSGAVIQLEGMGPYAVNTLK
ncbi:MAG: cupin domain-containing protein [Candidatus Eremiobacteraeota bacterium]|nr:cupin domain-containing protein [Candidatus Eremiobacteraeota bacterium]MBV8284838.1 cupin domain-containing protein [Candidatus Eremiobacteraeota bacterium]MBV8433151.1 cupin domain-containing protein [Candidatus Eremiobacteraeota bacterium]